MGSLAASLGTLRSDNFGAISRSKNTQRLWVPPSLIHTGTVTGTWAMSMKDSQPVFGTSDVGAASGEILVIPCPLRYSDAKIEGSGAAVDRGIRIIGLEVLYTVETSALAAFALAIQKGVQDADGDAGAVTSVTTTQVTDDDDTSPLEVDDHRVGAFIAERDRFFVTSDFGVWGLLTLGDGTSSDVFIYGARWYLEAVEE